MKESKDYGIIFWLHLVINIIFLASFILFSWWIILVGVILLELQFIILKGCILSKAEFGKDEACVPYYFKKWGFIKDKDKTKIFIRYILPFIILGLAILSQLMFNHQPLVF